MKVSQGHENQQQNIIFMDELVRNFKTLSSKSILGVKVLETKATTEFLTVDLFIGEENICNLLVENTISSLKLAAIKERVKLVQGETEFNGILVNYNNKQNVNNMGSRFGLGISVINESMLNYIDELSVGWTDLSQKLAGKSKSNVNSVDMVVMMAPLPIAMVDYLQLKQKFGRVSGGILFYFK